MSAWNRAVAPLMALGVLVLVMVVVVSRRSEVETTRATFERATRVHLDHAAYFKEPFRDGPSVTRACLECHQTAAAELMRSAHWTWLGDEVRRPGQAPVPVGKKNLINNFCIAAQGNGPGCMKCHAGYGWKDDTFDFRSRQNVDCLVCHDRTGSYAKGAGGAAGRRRGPAGRRPERRLPAAGELRRLPRLRRRRPRREARRPRLRLEHPSRTGRAHRPRAVPLRRLPPGQGAPIHGRSFAVSVQSRAGLPAPTATAAARTAMRASSSIAPPWPARPATSRPTPARCPPSRPGTGARPATRRGQTTPTPT